MAQNAGLSVMTFTGHRLEELQQMQGARSLLAHTDLLVDGRYDAERRDPARPWVGSTNQRFHFLTERYQQLSAELQTMPDRVEVQVRPDGRVLLNGWATVDQLDELLAETSDVSVGRGRVR